MSLGAAFVEDIANYMKYLAFLKAIDNLLPKLSRISYGRICSAGKTSPPQFLLKLTPLFVIYEDFKTTLT